MVSKPVARIDNWRVLGEIGYGAVLIGRISDHPNQLQFKGKYQQTSVIVKLDLYHRTCETRDTLYHLGKEYVNGEQK